MPNSTTDVSYCLQRNHSVPREQMTTVHVRKGVTRRMCTACADRWLDDKAARKLPGYARLAKAAHENER